ncbi:hypothetical protein [Nitrosomonas eutropha]|uniref:Uncharacterized protein n=2 Tax=Nitrosomonas eutropha TaxID=916 RepID=A0ABX5M7W3_9PROT|nr:hypothetical protein [Nitrosomonas eutropha]ABI58523.1 conserved hypothetical protein [Nitrosomonas eutropha C91]PXV82318.1 hypothetical protein C8R14_10829 [Nitrosomonas eutropha]
MTLKSTIKEFAAFLGNQESILDRDYPRVVDQSRLLWGYAEFSLYLEKLLVTEKGRDRGGFSFEVILELDKLKEIHERRFPRKS